MTLPRFAGFAAVASGALLVSACATPLRDPPPAAMTGRSAVPAVTATPAEKVAPKHSVHKATRSIPKPAAPARSLTVCRVRPDAVAWRYLSGPCRRGFAHGRGEALSVDGERRYRGGFVGGFFQGEGHYDWGNGVHYTGGFRQGAKAGQGRIEYADNAYYKGAFDRNLYHGRGTYVAADGSRYEGEFCQGTFCGKGTYRWANGDRYEGEFRDNRMHGQGRYVRANGEIYRGQFVANERSGHGVYSWPDGSRYTGQFLNDAIHGEGTYEHADGSRYIGLFKDGQQHGWGKLASGSGDVWQQWENGRKIAESRLAGGGESATVHLPR